MLVPVYVAAQGDQALDSLLFRARQAEIVSRSPSEAPGVESVLMSSMLHTIVIQPRTSVLNYSGHLGNILCCSSYVVGPSFGLRAFVRNRFERLLLSISGVWIAKLSVSPCLQSECIRWGRGHWSDLDTSYYLV